jgi:DNA-directed RNA polymerase II subunit RPB1
MDTEIYSYDNEKTLPIDRIEFAILGSEEIKRMSALGRDSAGIEIPELYDNLEPKRGGLIDPRLGTTENQIDCATCGLSNAYCVGHFGHIDLAEPMFHIGFLPHVKKILSLVCLKCSKLLIHKNENEIEEMIKTKSGKARTAELRNLVKNVKYCQKANYGCGTPVSKIKLDIKKTTGAINIISETNLANLPTEEGESKEMKKKNVEILTPDIVYNILKNINDMDCLIMGIDPSKSRPEMMIHKSFPVPPVAIRPSATVESLSSSTLQDDLTHKLADIIKANARIMKQKDSQNENAIKYGQDHNDLLQFHIATYIDNESSMPRSEQKGKVTRSLSSRLKGKEGRIRGNLMG